MLGQQPPASRGRNHDARSAVPALSRDEAAIHGVLPDRQAVLALAEADYGIGILPSAIAAVPESTKLLPLVHDGIPIGRWTMIAWSRRRAVPLFASTFVDEFSAFARRHYPGRDVLRKAPGIPMPR